METRRKTDLIRRGLVATLALAVWLVITSMPVGAVVTVDQSFTEGDDLGASISDGCRYVGQSFTAGATGRLVGVNLDVRTDLYSGVHPLRVAIRTAWRDKPYGDPLGYRYVYGDAPLDRLITFPQNIRVVASRQYAIVLSYRGAPLRATEVLGQWDGATGNLYPGGRLFFGECPTSSSPTFWNLSQVGAPYDVHFRTHVDRR